MKIEYLLKGVPVNPVNKREIFLEINHDQQSVINQPAPHVGINNLYFAREDVRKIMAMLNQAPGITEGIPFDIRISERGVTDVIQMYIDCMEGFTKSRDGMHATVKMLQSLDWLDDKVDAFTHESMYNETGVGSFVVDGITYTSYQDFFDRRCIFVPYVISTIPNWHDAFLGIFGMIYVGNELYKGIKQLIQWLTPIPGIGIVISVGQFALEVIYVTLLIITLIAMVEQLIACLIQPIKYHGAMLMSDLLKVTAAKLGLTSKSSIWDSAPFNEVAFIPEKWNPLEGTGSRFSLLGIDVGGFKSQGYTSPGYAPSTPHTSQTDGIQKGYYNGTGGDLLRFIKSCCNGKLIIPHATNDLLLERRDFYPASTLYQLPDLRQDWHTYNTDELTANILIKFLIDLNDRNCVDHVGPNGPFFPGTIFQATHQQVQTTNKALVMLKGMRDININAARGVAKDSLTFVEQAVLDLQRFWDFIETAVVNVGIGLLNTLILAANVIITALNVLIAVWNLILTILEFVTDIINVIIDAINSIPGIDIDNITVFDGGAGRLDYVDYIDFVSFQSLPDRSYSDRLGALLLENDLLNTPKLVMVDTSRSEFANGRIAYIHNDNASVVNAATLWNRFYFIDAFVNPGIGTSESATNNGYCNRQTLITPSNNKNSEKNRTSLSVADWQNLVFNPKFLDNFSEEVISDSIRWHLEQNGAAEFLYRKPGWLRDPQNPNVTKRTQEININLTIKTSIPNGQ